MSDGIRYAVSTIVLAEARKVEFQRPNNFLVPSFTSAELKNLTKVVSGFGGHGINAGVFPTAWATIDYDKFIGNQNLYSKSGLYNLVNNYGGIRRVDEKVTSAYLQADLKTEIAGLPVRGDVGFRFARTELESRGYQIGLTPQQVTAEHAYNDVLPSLNVSVAVGVILAEAERQRLKAGLYERSRLTAEEREQTLFEWSYPDIAERCRQLGRPYPKLTADGRLAANPLLDVSIATVTEE